MHLFISFEMHRKCLRRQRTMPILQHDHNQYSSFRIELFQYNSVVCWVVCWHLVPGSGKQKNVIYTKKADIWRYVEKIRRCLTNALCSLKIDFIGEDENDLGGPTREFFSEFFQSTVGRLVHGREMNYCFLHDSVGTLKEHFKSFGQIVAITVARGCHGPRFFFKNTSWISCQWPV